jgi:PKD repeat protein
MSPTAVAQARPTEVNEGETVTFDGSTSYDDLTTTANLQYEWDFDGDGTFDANGQVTTNVYNTPGTYNAQLRVTDEGGLSSTDTVAITVNEVEQNQAPVAQDDAATVEQGSSVDVDVLANDSDPDGDSLTITGFTNGSNGTVSQNPDGTLNYAHDGSATTADSFSYTISDGDLSDSATVNITITNDPNPGDVEVETTGGGWLAVVDGKKINYGFDINANSSVLDGSLELNDKGADVKIQLHTVTAVSEITGSCGSIPAAANSVEFQGNGTFNNTNATFRVCVQDNGEPGKNHDRFYLGCLTGCTYNTSDRTADDIIDGGNVQVAKSSTTAVKKSFVAKGKNNGESSSATLILDPLLMTEGIIGQLQLFTVRAYDADQNLLTNASITLVRTRADGTVDTFTAVTDGTGTATITLVNLSQTTEYVATADGVESNAVEISPILSALP